MCLGVQSLLSDIIDIKNDALANDCAASEDPLTPGSANYSPTLHVNPSSTQSTVNPSSTQSTHRGKDDTNISEFEEVSDEEEDKDEEAEFEVYGSSEDESYDEEVTGKEVRYLY